MVRHDIVLMDVTRRQNRGRKLFGLGDFWRNCIIVECSGRANF
jgi:hypothetical protein